ncbi:unnamed protein product [Rhizophagus irregularis]|nr:unnamed protein product [Rhizophagus irregularis]
MPNPILVMLTPEQNHYFFLNCIPGIYNNYGQTCSPNIDPKNRNPAVAAAAATTATTTAPTAPTATAPTATTATATTAMGKQQQLL